MKIKCLLIISLFFTTISFAQTDDYKLPGKVKRNVKRIGQFNVVMIGSFAANLDKMYQDQLELGAVGAANTLNNSNRNVGLTNNNRARNRYAYSDPQR